MLVRFEPVASRSVAFSGLGYKVATVLSPVVKAPAAWQFLSWDLAVPANQAGSITAPPIPSGSWASAHWTKILNASAPYGVQWKLIVLYGPALPPPPPPPPPPPAVTTGGGTTTVVTGADSVPEPVEAGFTLPPWVLWVGAGLLILSLLRSKGR